MTNRLHTLALVGCALLLTACASVDFDYPKTATSAPAPDTTRDTALGLYAQSVSTGQQPDHSGFHMLPNAVDALAARLLLAERAERTLDAQYYLVKADDAGLAFVRALLAAADRGVRVRLLIDDMFTAGHDIGLAALDHHPNLEIRIFNPFANRGARFWDGLTDLSRINRRMHNKSFTVDNQVTIIGGRNIADEYFGSRVDARFGDLDVLAVGPVVSDVSASFDSYWNHVRAAPIPAFARMPDDPDAALASVRKDLEAARLRVIDGVYADAVRQSSLAILQSQNDLLTWAPYVLAVDSPDKSFKRQAESAVSIRSSLQESLATANDEMILVSPYFVPRKTGIEALSAVAGRGVDVKVITNSLSANNQFSVHAGYAPSRKPLLRAGVELYEVRRDAGFAGQELVAASGAKSTLHTKAFVIDRRELFVGSFNFDPRSANINTEMGVIIRSPQMASKFTDAVYAALPKSTWQVSLDADNKLLWQSIDPNGATVFTNKEPQTTWWDRFLAGFMRVLPIRGQL